MCLGSGTPYLLKRYRQTSEVHEKTFPSRADRLYWDAFGDAAKIAVSALSSSIGSNSSVA